MRLAAGRAEELSGLHFMHGIRGWWCILLATLLLRPVSVVCDCETVNSTSETRVVIVSLMSNKYIDKRTTDSLETGFNASLQARKRDKKLAANVSFITLTQNQNPEQVLRSCIGNKSGLVVAYGPMGDAQTVKMRSVLKELDVVGFAPFTGSTEVRGWNPHLYFLRPAPAAELATLIRYALAYLRVQRLGFMYLRGVSYGEKEYDLAVEWLAQMDYKLCCVFSVSSSLENPVDDNVFDTTYEQFIMAKPQVVLLFGSPIHDTKKFIKRLLKDKRASETYLFVPVYIQIIFMECMREIFANTGHPFSGLAMVTGTTPPSNDRSYYGIRRFHKEMEEFFSTHSDLTGSLGLKALYADENHGTHMAHGWIVGEVLTQALSSKDWLASQSVFRESLFNQRRYIVDDLVFGDFGGECNDNVAALGAMCRCNQGGNVVFMKRVLPDLRVQAFRAGCITVGASNCYVSAMRLHPPLNGLFIFMEDNSIALRANSAMFSSAITLNGDGKLGSTDRLFTHMLNTTVSNATTALREDMDTKIATAVFGVVEDSVLSFQNMTFIDPIPLVPRLNSYRREVIHLSPTVEQQFFVLAEYLVYRGSTRPRAVVCSDDAANFIDVLHETMATHGGSLGITTRLDVGSGMKQHLPTTGDVFVVGLSPRDAVVLAEHLKEHQGVRVLLLFSEFALYYDILAAVFQGEVGAHRLLFASHLPHWAATNSNSTTVKKYHAAVGDPKRWSPLSLLGFTTARAIQEVAQHQDRMNPRSLANYFYANIAVRVDDMRYGPFDENKCITARNLRQSGCVVNYGATRIAVWSMARALNASVKETFPARTPSMVYRSSMVLGLAIPTFVGVTMMSLILILIFIGVLVMQCSKRSVRDNRNAPKEPTAPVTLVFTDIESSTALWAACPELMPDAVAAHHRLIRSLIVRHRCYEVKTIGDSFMIACRSPFAAVQLVRDLQQQFLVFNWNTSAIDESYREFEQQRADEDADYVPPTAHLDPEAYWQLWSGLRVRAGVHTGLCDVQYDEVTKGYDYYGSTSNTAARTESVANGGQVLLTRATYMAMTASERVQLDVTPLGAVPLRGVPKPVEMYQLNAVPGRTFAALRLDLTNRKLLLRVQPLLQVKATLYSLNRTSTPRQWQCPFMRCLAPLLPITENRSYFHAASAGACSLRSIAKSGTKKLTRMRCVESPQRWARCWR
ncbi:Adenylate and Guanylate cyclase catalytic domain [Trypanosoma vivax]|nr:Adenylate and Guanylate cyclase catalytic domain [Trypanosoma vivax]